MVKNKYRDRFLIVGLILAILFSNLPVVLTAFYHEITREPQAIKGSLDLSSVNQTDDKIYLDGQWEFYWEHFLISESEQTTKPDLMIEVPDEWSNYKIDGKKLPAKGYGSYKMVLTGLSYQNMVTVFIPDIGIAYRAFVDGQLAAESGVISKDMDKLHTVPKSHLYPVTLSVGTTHEIVIEVATTRFSGIYMMPILGDYHQIVSQNNLKTELRFILFGVALFSFLSLIAIYIFNIRRKIHSLWMPSMVFLILIRSMLTTEFYSYWQSVLFFNLSYESMNEVMYLITFILKYLLIFLLEEQCGITFSKKEKRGFFIYYSVLYLIYIFTPKIIYNSYLSVLIPMLTYCLDIYLFIKIYRSRQKMKKFGVAVLWGAMLVSVGLAIDSYYINGKIHWDMSLTMLVLFLIFLVIMSWVYTMRIGDLYDDFTISSSRLELANSQLSMQNEYYETLSGQMNEIREIKHDMRHFIGVMSLLAEEGKLDKLRDFLSEYGENTKMEQLPVFCENLIANSIIGYYYLRAKEAKIPLEIRCNIAKQAVMSDSDLCIVLGNSLENAIYACRQMDPSKGPFVLMEAETMKGQWLLKVKNSYQGKLKINNGRYISSKGGNAHGLGLLNIKKVLGTYGGFVKIDHNEKEFTLMAAVPEIQKEIP